MAGPAVAAVDGLGMAHVKGFESAFEAIFPRRHRNQMDVIVHQAISKDINPVLAAIGRQPGQVATAIIVTEEHRLAAVAALGDVMGNTGKNGARNPRHGGRMPASS